MKLSNSEIRNSFTHALNFKSKEEEIEHREHLIMFRFLSEIERVMEEKGMNKKTLAKKLGTSASYITQLFRGDKIINLHTLAKVEVEFEREFSVRLAANIATNDLFTDFNEDEMIKYLNRRCANEGQWIFHGYRKASITSANYSDVYAEPQFENAS